MKETQGIFPFDRLHYREEQINFFFILWLRPLVFFKKEKSVLLLNFLSPSSTVGGLFTVFFIIRCTHSFVETVYFIAFVMICLLNLYFLSIFFPGRSASRAWICSYLPVCMSVFLDARLWSAGWLASCT